MGTTSNVFRPVSNEDAIYLKQVSQSEAQSEEGNILTVMLPDQAETIVIGLIHQGLGGTASVIVFGLIFLLGAFGLVILWLMLSGRMDIRLLIAEADGKASLSRFQALIFTFVIAGGFLAVLVETGTFPTNIPIEIVYILAGSLGTFLASKGIQSSREEAGAAPLVRAEDTSPPGPLVRFGSDTEFTVHPGAQTANSEPHKTVVPCSSRGPNHDVTVAVAVGKCRLKVSSIFSPVDMAVARAMVTTTGGETEIIDLTGIDELQTQAGQVSEIRLFFKPKALDHMAIPVVVEQLA